MRNEKLRDFDTDELAFYADDEVWRLSRFDDFCLQCSSINEPFQKEPLMLLLTICGSVAHDAQLCLGGSV